MPALVTVSVASTTRLSAMSGCAEIAEAAAPDRLVELGQFPGHGGRAGAAEGFGGVDQHLGQAMGGLEQHEGTGNLAEGLQAVAAGAGFGLGNRTHAAKILGISIRTLRNKLNEYVDAGLSVAEPGSVRAMAAYG